MGYTEKNDSLCYLFIVEPHIHSIIIIIIINAPLRMDQNKDYDRYIYESIDNWSTHSLYSFLSLSSVFVKTLTYVKRFSRYKNRTAVKEVRSLLTKKNLEELEIASLANLCPENAEGE